MAENEQTPVDPAQEGRNRITCGDANINSKLDEILKKNLVGKYMKKIDIPIPILLNQSHKGARCEYKSSGECRISIGNSGLPEDKLLYILMEELAHAAQFCEHGYDIMVSAKLNFEIEAKVWVHLELLESGSIEELYLDYPFTDICRDLAGHYYFVGYEDLLDSFQNLYEDTIDDIRHKPRSNYSNENEYPENPDYRNFNTFHEDYQNYINSRNNKNLN